MIISKSELVSLVGEKSNFPKTQVDRILTACFETIQNEVSNFNSVQISGFGTFASANRAERTYRNPVTGEPVVKSAHRVPVFRAGELFKRKLDDM